MLFSAMRKDTVKSSPILCLSLWPDAHQTAEVCDFPLHQLFEPQNLYQLCTCESKDYLGLHRILSFSYWAQLASKLMKTSQFHLKKWLEVYIPRVHSWNMCADVTGATCDSQLSEVSLLNDSSVMLHRWILYDYFREESKLDLPLLNHKDDAFIA